MGATRRASSGDGAKTIGRKLSRASAWRWLALAAGACASCVAGDGDTGRPSRDGQGAEHDGPADGGIAFGMQRDGGADARAQEVAPAPDTLSREVGGADAPADAAQDATPEAAGETPRDLPAGEAGPQPEPGRLAGITKAHNDVRAQIPVPPLAWDAQLAASAQSWASRCMFVHSMTPGLGENLAAYAPPGSGAAATVVKGWADERVFYDYATNTCAAGRQCGHYTQVVWRSSTRVGCAVQTCTQNSPFPRFPMWDLWVCQYAPPGNVRGQKPY